MRDVYRTLSSTLLLAVLIASCDGTSLEQRLTGSGGSSTANTGLGGSNAPAGGAGPGAAGALSSGRTDGGQGKPGLEFVPIRLDGDPTFVSHFRFLPGSSQFLALTKLGSVLHYELEGDTTRLLGSFDIPSVSTDTDCGLMSLTFDPHFDENGYVYIGMCFSVSESGIVRYQFDPDDYDHIADSGAEILRAGSSSATKGVHSVGQIGFDPDGNMWALFGEKNTRTPAQDPDSRLGKLLRFQLDDTSISPLPGAARGLTYALGFRSPWTGLLDSRGRFWVGDVGSSGEDSREEVNLVTREGVNFGWPDVEGACGSSCSGFDDPLVSWRRGDFTPYEQEDPEVAASNSRVSWVGLEYRPNGDDPYAGLLDDSVLVGDLCLGFVRGLRVDENDQLIGDRPLGHLVGGVAWEQGPGGYVYAVTYGRCTHSTGAALPPGQLMKAVLGQISIE